MFVISLPICFALNTCPFYFIFDESDLQHSQAKSFQNLLYQSVGVLITLLHLTL